jgi:hypothetical protein
MAGLPFYGELCLAAVKANPYAVQHVAKCNGYEEICHVAVSGNQEAMRFIIK